MSTKSVSKKSQKSSLDLQELTGTPTLIISSELQEQVQYLHKVIGDKEWSGPLIYEVVEGNTDNPDDLVVKAKGMFLMDIGEGSSTDFEMTEDDTFELTDYYPSLMQNESRLGLIHTHHNMRIYFSGVDNDELKDNAEDYNAYLSLIVGYNLKYKGRIAFITEKKKENITKFSTKNMNDESFEFASKEEDTEKVVCYYDCDIRIQMDIEDRFQERYELVKKRKEEEKKKRKTVSRHQGNYPYTNGYGRAQRKIGFGERGNSTSSRNNNPLDSKYTLSDIRSFLCKICSFDPTNNGASLTKLLSKMDKQTSVHVYLNKENVLNIVDDCVSETFSENEAKEMTIDDKADLLLESIDYLTEEVGSKQSLVEQSQTAQAAHDALEDIVDEMIQNMQSEQNSENNEFNWF